MTESVYKILVVGDVSTGKTSIVKRYVQGVFSQHIKSTVGVDFALKVIKMEDDSTVRLQLWDIAGQERFGKMTRVYYQDAVAAFVVFDATRMATYEGTKKWKADIDSKITLSNGEPIPVVLLANKIDLVEGEEDWDTISSQIEEYCQTEGFLGWFKTSAKDNLGIDSAGNALVQEIVKRVGEPEEKEMKGTKLVAKEDTGNRVEETNCC